MSSRSSSLLKIVTGLSSSFSCSNNHHPSLTTCRADCTGPHQPTVRRGPGLPNSKSQMAAWLTMALHISCAARSFQRSRGAHIFKLYLRGFFVETIGWISKIKFWSGNAQLGMDLGMFGSSIFPFGCCPVHEGLIRKKLSRKTSVPWQIGGFLWVFCGWNRVWSE